MRNTERLKGKNAILLLSNSSETTLDRYRPFFTNVRKIGSNEYLFRGQSLWRLDLDIILGENYQGGWQPVVNKP
ncbi:hypothetical protein ACFL3F_03805 [Planctomycetota bacterium]